MAVRTSPSEEERIGSQGSKSSTCRDRTSIAALQYEPTGAGSLVDPGAGFGHRGTVTEAPLAPRGRQVPQPPERRPRTLILCEASTYFWAPVRVQSESGVPNVGRGRASHRHHPLTIPPCQRELLLDACQRETARGGVPRLSDQPSRRIGLQALKWLATADPSYGL